MRGEGGEKTCESCGIKGGGDSGKKLLECGGCLTSYFCSTSCQQQSWKSHKKLCRQRKKSVIKIQSNWRGWYTRSRRLMLNNDDRCEVCKVVQGEVRNNGKKKQLHLCNGCKLSLYCSKKCQEYDWKRHKKICRDRQRAVLKIQFLWRKHHKQQESIKCGKKLDEKNASPTTPTRVMSARRVMLSWAAMPFAIFILSGIIHASDLYDFFRALTRWDKHMMQSLSEKWEVQLTESEKAREIAARGLLTGMIFYRRFRKRKEPFVCHPFDALSNLKWNVDWDAYLDEDEIEYVLNNAGTFAQNIFNFIFI